MVPEKERKKGRMEGRKKGKRNVFGPEFPLRTHSRQRKLGSLFCQRNDKIIFEKLIF
jgi:hypothetical protein